MTGRRWRVEKRPTFAPWREPWGIYRDGVLMDAHTTHHAAIWAAHRMAGTDRYLNRRQEQS